MFQTATVTSKRQLTIPSAFFRDGTIHEGEKVVVTGDGDGLKVIPALRLIDKLAGSVIVSKEFRGLSPDEMVEKAKKKYFDQRK